VFGVASGVSLASIIASMNSDTKGIINAGKINIGQYSRGASGNQENRRYSSNIVDAESHRYCP
jgi:hypothetical protein